LRVAVVHPRGAPTEPSRGHGLRIDCRALMRNSECSPTQYVVPADIT